MIPRLSSTDGDLLRSFKPGSGFDGRGSRSFFIALLSTLILSSSILAGSVANETSTGVSANCNECHEPSIYLLVGIRFIDAPPAIMRNESTTINVTIEVSGSHKSYVWSGFGMDVRLVPGTDRTYCGPRQIINGQKPSGRSSPYTWIETFTFHVNSSFIGNETITVKARMSPIHESPPVTAEDTLIIPVVADKDSVFSPGDGDRIREDQAIPGGDVGKQGIGPIGITIMIMGAIAVLAGLVYAGYSILAPIEKKARDGRVREGEPR